MDGAGAGPDVADLLFAADDYVTAEPFIEYQRDARCLAVADELWAMTREGASCKAMWIPGSTGRTQHVGADALGLDFLERPPPCCKAEVCLG